MVVVVVEVVCSCGVAPFALVALRTLHPRLTAQDIAGVDAGGVAAQLTDRESFVLAMQERGVGGSKRVVVYDNGDMLFATRFWWAMR